MDPSYIAGLEADLRAMVIGADWPDISGAACRGVDADTYHPEDGPPDDLAMLRCSACRARLACLAVALRCENPDIRAGWYGGLGPDDRDAVAATLALPDEASVVVDRALEANRLRAAGWTIGEIANHFGCCRRTVQRYLRAAA